MEAAPEDGAAHATLAYAFAWKGWDVDLHGGDPMPDLNAASVEAAMKTVEGTARSMGMEVTD